jgi:hypothetical protein
MRAGEPQYILPVRLGRDEGVRLAKRASLARMSRAAYIRMLINRDWGDYQTQKQEAIKWMLEGKGHEPTITEIGDK